MKMYQLSIVSIFLFFLAGCEGSEESGNPSPLFEPFITPAGFTVEEVVEGLNLPTSLAFAPDGSGRLFVNELQTGNVQVIQGDSLLPRPFVSLATFVSGGFPVDGENGLIGIAFDPDYERNRYVYFSYAVWSSSDTLGKVIRFRDENNRGVEGRLLLDSIPGGSAHQVQSLRFGPDGKLYIAIGDAFRPNWAQDTAQLPGSILRMNPDGSIPLDNPFLGSYIYASGLRNPFDMTFTEGGELLAADIGAVLEDEINVIESGANYAWPLWSGAGNQNGYVDPIHTWLESVSPTGMEWYGAEVYPEPYRNSLMMVLFGKTFEVGPSTNSKRIQVLTFQGQGQSTQVSFTDLLIYNLPALGNPLDIALGPDGLVYFTDIFRGKVFRLEYQAE
ncbi:MAG: PQQ-dependent sugar dehydrogenase [Bacteroidota bacterium]